MNPIVKSFVFHTLAGVLSGGSWLAVMFFLFPWPADESPDAPEASKASKPIVIAHRGASGYLVEHSEGSKVLAHAQGADFIEQDVVLTNDRVFIVSHDITMAETTDVEAIYPDRHRSDGKWYFADFTWAEIQKLTLHERTHKDSAERAFPDRFPGGFGQRVLRLEEEIQLLEGLDRTTGRRTGLYIELKGPEFHRKEFSVSMGAELLKVLKRFELDEAKDRCFIQCFELQELVSLHKEHGCKLPLVYLIGGPIAHEKLKELSSTIAGLGPSLELLATRSAEGIVQSTGLVEAAKEAGLVVHPYTVRKESQPRWSKSLGETHRVLIELLKVDGFFSDFPDTARQAVDGT
jgi:glycerophosphoryl diester phosphodiesterase